MLRRFNYTKRTTIRKGDVDIVIREVSGASPVATFCVNLDSYALPDDAEVVVEAYRRASYMRERMGTVGERPDRFEFTLREFDTPDGVQFRIKVVGRREDADKDAPLLLAVADKISPTDGDDEDQDIEKLLSLLPADLNGELWRIDLTDKPVLLIERAYWEERQFVRSGWFFPLVVPSVLREALRGAFADKYRELDEDTWQSRWLNFALSIPVDQDLPDPEADSDEIDTWINFRIEAFCRSEKMCDRVEPIIRGAD